MRIEITEFIGSYTDMRCDKLRTPIVGGPSRCPAPPEYKLLQHRNDLTQGPFRREVCCAQHVAQTIDDMFRNKDTAKEVLGE